MIILKNKYQILKILFLIALVTSVAMSLEEKTGVCGVGSGCEKVENTIYAETFGLKNYWYGIAIFAFLVALTDSHIEKPSRDGEKVLKISIIIGCAISLYFLYLQQYVINAYCKYCIVIDTSLIIAAVIYFLTKKA